MSDTEITTSEVVELDRTRLAATIPPEPQITGAVGAALFAFDRARKKPTITTGPVIGPEQEIT
jgi:hypothetical protein